MAVLSGGKRYCLTVHLEGMMKQGPQACEKMLKREDGTSISGEEAMAKLWAAWLAGYEVLPVCANHDRKGHCLGHDK